MDAFVPQISPLDKPTIKLPSPTFRSSNGGIGGVGTGNRAIETADLCLGWFWGPDFEFSNKVVGEFEVFDFELFELYCHIIYIIHCHDTFQGSQVARLATRGEHLLFGQPMTTSGTTAKPAVLHLTPVWSVIPSYWKNSSKCMKVLSFLPIPILTNIDLPFWSTTLINKWSHIPWLKSSPR